MMSILVELGLGGGREESGGGFLGHGKVGGGSSWGGGCGTGGKYAGSQHHSLGLPLLFPAYGLKFLFASQ